MVGNTTSTNGVQAGTRCDCSTSTNNGSYHKCDTQFHQLQVSTTSKSRRKSLLREYCEQTSLHGWYYISGSTRPAWKLIWMVIVMTSVGVAAVFIYKAAEDFTKSTVVTTIRSTSEPLSNVYFPAVTVCNINQVRTFLLISPLRIIEEVVVVAW